MVSARVLANRIVTKSFYFPDFPEDKRSPKFFTRTWYPESAHFARQQWPTPPPVPRLSCAVFLLTEHNSEGHPVNFIIAQHYFDMPSSGEKPVVSLGQYQRQRQVALQANGISPTPNGASINAHADNGQDPDEAEGRSALSDGVPEVEGGKPIARMWFVNSTFEGIRSVEEDEANEDRICSPSRQNEGKVTTIYVAPACGHGRERSHEAEEGWRKIRIGGRDRGAGPTPPIPDELGIDRVETMDLDQNQGAILFSVGGEVFVLCYD